MGGVAAEAVERTGQALAQAGDVARILAEHRRRQLGVHTAIVVAAEAWPNASPQPSNP